MRIIYIDVDSLRPDHLGCYGYHRNTSPNIDQLAEEGRRFDNVYVSDAPCLPSRTGLTTGMFGIRSGAVGHGGTAGDPYPEGPDRKFQSALSRHCLPRIFRRADMQTVLFSPFAERHSTWHFYAGFNEMYNSGKNGMEQADDVTPDVLDWLDRKGSDDNWYMHINYWDPHTYYRTPDAFGNPFADEPMPEWLTPEVLEHHRSMPGPHGAREVNMYNSNQPEGYPRHVSDIKDMTLLKKHIDGYDCGIAYTDQHIGMLIQKLKDMGIYEDTAIVISADHGENQGELGLYAEHATADDITCHIPMIIKWPGMKTGVDTDLHYHLDWLPTVAELLDQDPQPEWDGESYAPSLTEGDSCGRPSVVLSQCAHVCQRSLRFENWLYMETTHCGFHLYPDRMLFDLENDPHEQHNLADDHPEVCEAASAQIAEWRAEMLARTPGKPDPMDVVMDEGGPYHANQHHLPPYLERLRKTERAEAADKLEARYLGTSS